MYKQNRTGKGQEDLQKAIWTKPNRKSSTTIKAMNK